VSQGNYQEPPVTAYLWEDGRKRRPLTLFSAPFPHPVQGVSPAALNALAAALGRFSVFGDLVIFDNFCILYI
jgi:hypothetical protein